MGLFDTLFGRKPDTKEALIRAISALRIRSDPASKVLGYNEKMLDDLSKEQIYMLPEASIVTIVETYVGMRRQGVPARQIIEAIEDFRAQTSGSLPAPLPTSIFDFVADRINLEHKHGAKLDEEFIDNAIHTSSLVFGLEIDMPERPPYKSHVQIYVEQYEIVIASYKRRERGYIFPWRLMAFHKDSREFAFSFNLEITAVSCCFGSHQADGTHFNYGEANPDMTQAEFEEWVVPRLIARVYGESLLSEDEMHILAIRFVAKQIVNGGFGVSYIEEDPRIDPQIVAVKPDGTPAAIIVRASAFPDTAFVNKNDAQFEDFIENGFDGEVLFARVMLGNADARNDIEKRAVLRTKHPLVLFDGLKKY